MVDPKTLAADKALIATVGIAKLARRLGTNVQRVWNWTQRGIPSKVKLEHPDLFLKKTVQQRGEKARA